MNQKNKQSSEPLEDQSLYNNEPELELPDNNQEVASFSDSKTGLSFELKSMVIDSLTLFDKILKERLLILKELNGGKSKTSYT